MVEHHTTTAAPPLRSREQILILEISTITKLLIGAGMHGHRGTIRMLRRKLVDAEIALAELRRETR